MKKNKSTKTSKNEKTTVPLNEQKPALILNVFQRQTLLYEKKYYQEKSPLEDLAKIYSSITEMPTEHYTKNPQLILDDVMNLTERLSPLNRQNSFSEVVLNGFKNGKGNVNTMLSSLLNGLFYVQTNNGEKLFLDLGKADARLLPLNPYP